MRQESTLGEVFARYMVEYAKPRKKSLAARLDGKTLEQQGVHKAVADWEAHAANYNPAYAQGYAKALVAIAQQRHADEPMPAAGGEEP